MAEVVPLKRTRLPRSRDAFYQAIPVNEIQGRYFHFGRNKISAAELSERERQKANSLLTALPEGRNFEIIHDSNYGVPGALAYRIWTAFEKTLSDFGSDFDGRLKLSTRQISKMAGRSYNGKVANEIAIAIKQLERSEIIYWYENPADLNETGAPNIQQETFSLIDKVSMVREGRNSSPNFYVVTVPEIILAFLFHDRYFFCMSWERVKDLPPQSQSVARILYRYMSYRYSQAKSANFTYVKDYSTMCESWFGGLKPEERLSRAKVNHLAPRFDPIVKTGLLKNYSITENKLRDGFNVTFTPGNDFFADFASFYQKQLPLQLDEHRAKRDTHLGKPDSDPEDAALALLGEFHDAWFGPSAKRDYLNAEIEFAKQIIADNDFASASRFVKWGIEQARAKQFEMNTFNGLKTYYRKWASEREREDKRLQLIDAREEEQARLRLESDYEAFCKNAVIEAMDTMDESEREAITRRARAQLLLDFPNKKDVLRGHLLSVERKLVADDLDLPSFPDWIKTKP